MAGKKVAKKPISRARATSTSTSKGRKKKETTVVEKPKKSTKKTATQKKTTGKGRGYHREMNPETGYAVGSDQDIIATALLKGGKTRQEIIESLRKKLDSTTRNGTEKPVSNVVSSVFNRMISRGYRLESHFQLLPPTPASKRAATRAANKK